MFTIRKSRQLDLSIAVMSDCFDRGEIQREIHRAYTSGDLAPGRSRLTVISDEVEVSAADAPDLRAIAKQIRAFETTTRGITPYSSVFVVGTDHQAVAIEIYMAIWEVEHVCPPDFHLFRSLQEAVARLEVPTSMVRRVQMSVALD